MIDSFNQIHAYILDPDRFVVVLVAIVVVAAIGVVTGPSHGNANPWYWMFVDKFFGGLGSRLDRRDRKPGDLVFRGFFVTILVIIFSYGAGQGGAALVRAVPFYNIFDVLLLSLTMTAGSVWYALLKLFFAMDQNKLQKGAYYALARTTRSDLSASDDYTITRAGMGLAARSFDKGLVAPSLWYLLFGLPGAFVYAGLAAMVWRFGRDGQTTGFGKIALALEKLMGAVPMVLSGTLIALAGLFTPTAGMSRSFWGQLAGGDSRARYEEGGLPVTAMAYSLDVSLGGPAPDLDGHAIKRGWTGPPKATARLEPYHLRRAIYINFMAHLLFILALLSAMLWGGRLF